jgi:hypothetical protein
VDTPFLLDDGWKLSTRFDVPFIYSDVPSLDNPNGDYEFRFSDTLTQALFISPPQGRFANESLFVNNKSEIFASLWQLW